jgi:hypothetical protein
MLDQSSAEACDGSEQEIDQQEMADRMNSTLFSLDEVPDPTKRLGRWREQPIAMLEAFEVRKACPEGPCQGSPISSTMAASETHPASSPAIGHRAPLRL